MCEEIILNDWNPSADTLRKWAYDERILLASQDEDLAVGQRNSLPTLIPIADDPNCPKADYILSCLDFHLTYIILRSADSQLIVVQEAIAICENTTRAEIAEWSDSLKRRLSYRAGIGTVDRAIALNMGHELLNGICRNCEISISDESETEIEVQLSGHPYYAYRDRLKFDKATGLFSWHSRSRI